MILTEEVIDQNFRTAYKYVLDNYAYMFRPSLCNAEAFDACISCQVGWKCGRCGQVAESRLSPPKPYQFIKKVACCRKCNVPMVPTGNKRKHYSLRELL